MTALHTARTSSSPPDEPSATLVLGFRGSRRGEVGTQQVAARGAAPIAKHIARLLRRAKSSWQSVSGDQRVEREGDACCHLHHMGRG